MLKLTIEINFKNKEIITLYSESRKVKIKHSKMIRRMNNRFDHWRLEPNKVHSTYNFNWEYISGDVTLSSDEFLTFVGKNEKEALDIMIKNNPDVQESDLIKYITPEVKSFYTLLETVELESVNLHLLE